MQKGSEMSDQALSCSVCGKRYKRAAALKRHNKECSPCVSCGKVFTNVANRLRHETRCRYAKCVCVCVRAQNTGSRVGVVEV